MLKAMRDVFSEEIRKIYWKEIKKVLLRTEGSNSKSFIYTTLDSPNPDFTSPQSNNPALLSTKAAPEHHSHAWGQYSFVLGMMVKSENTVYKNTEMM